ncbi:hypothetical protein [Actinoplanes sp. NPDC051411]|uniref:hypothetical protein n=1 Tax=Actinoplanes sp. NPDC051411 TaxID=3155522 RepID=UPI0034423E76
MAESLVVGLIVVRPDRPRRADPARPGALGARPRLVGLLGGVLLLLVGLRRRHRRPGVVVVVAGRPDVDSLTDTNQRGCGNDNPYN